MYGAKYCLYRISLYLATGVLYAYMHDIRICVTYVVASEVVERVSFGISLFLCFMGFFFVAVETVILPEMSIAIPALRLHDFLIVDFIMLLCYCFICKLNLNFDSNFIFFYFPETFFMLHMSSGVMTLVVAAITAYIKHNTTRTLDVSVAFF